MSYNFKAYNYNQPYLLPPSLQEWLPSDHLAYFVCDVVEQMDLTLIHKEYTTSAKGQPSYDPLMMVRLLVHAYSVGVYSSRKIETKTHEDVAFRLVAADQHPDHDTIAEFRKRNLKALKELFVQVLLLCEQAGLVKLGHVALDGTKVKANASKHKAMSYDRMQKREKELAQEVEELLQEAQNADAQEDQKYGKGQKPNDLPEELRIKQNRLKKIVEAKTQLEEIAKQRADQKQQQREELEKQAQQEGRKVAGYEPKIDATPDPKAQKNFTDPESSIMKGSDGFIQAYNCQAVVDEHSQIIVANEVTNSPIDMKQVEPLMNQVYENLGHKPKKASMDAGYYSQENVQYLTDQGIDPYIATGRDKHNKKAMGPPRGRIGNDLTAKQIMARKLKTKEGCRIYSRRKVIVEPVFGQIKNRGFRQFSFRGLTKAKQEWAFVCTSHNILKLYRAGYTAGYN